MQIQRQVSLVDQVANLLRHRIRDRIYAPGQRIPSESELAHEFQVSRTTIRTVLARFASEGLISRKQGDGTFISERIEEVDTHYGGLWDFSRLIEASGFSPNIQTVSVQTRSATVSEKESLELEQGDNKVVSVLRLFTADDRPAIYATNIFPRALIKEDLDQFDGNLPLHDILKIYCNEEISYVISDIEAIVATDDLVKTLALEAPCPLLNLSEVFFNTDHKPLILGTSFYDFNKVRLRLVRAWG